MRFVFRHSGEAVEKPVQRVIHEYTAIQLRNRRIALRVKLAIEFDYSKEIVKAIKRLSWSQTHRSYNDPTTPTRSLIM